MVSLFCLIAEKRKSKKKEAGPKRARSAYIFFCTEHRPQVDGAFGEKTKKLSEMWKNLDGSVKQASKC